MLRSRDTELQSGRQDLLRHRDKQYFATSFHHRSRNQRFIAHLSGPHTILSTPPETSPNPQTSSRPIATLFLELRTELALENHGPKHIRIRRRGRQYTHHSAHRVERRMVRQP